MASVAPTWSSVTAGVAAMRDISAAVCSIVDAVDRSPDPAQMRVSCAALTHDLRLLAGLLFSLETLAADLEPPDADPVDADSLGLLQRVRLFLKAVEGLIVLTPCLVVHLGHEAKALASSLTFALARSRSINDLTMVLSVGHVSTLESDPVHVVAWLDLLISPRHNRETRSFRVERRLVERRRAEYPDYALAATRWLDYADEHWHALLHCV